MSAGVATVVGVDVGGTFTDVFVFGGDGAARTAKALTTRDVVTGMLDALDEAAVALGEVSSLTFGSTIATNALIERRLARTALLTTRGFRDVLETRRLWRRDLLGHGWDRPAAIVPRRLRFEARERIDWRGHVAQPLVDDDVLEAAERMRTADVEAVAVSFLFAYLNPDHELRAAELLRQALPDAVVVLSSEVNPERKEYERTSTTAIAAGLTPVVARSLTDVEAQLRERGLRGSLRVMKSNGGVMSPAAGRAKPVELVKSGPAGGMSAGLFLAQQLREPNLILLDIGGTSADASLIVDGRAGRADVETIDWDVPVRVPVVDIRSIGAGGGSIAWLDAGGRLHVGPNSAGAVPGPACYGRGGTDPTVTDAALVAGLLDPDYFLGGSIALDVGAAETVVDSLAVASSMKTTEAAAAVLHVAMTEMASLIREITVDRGFDPREFALVAFGGAGPLFLGMLLQELDIHRGYVPRHAAILSAMGGSFADVAYDYVRSLVAEVRDVRSADLRAAIDDLLERARMDLELEGLSDGEISTSADLRYVGQWHELEVQIVDYNLRDAAARFEAEHERMWGHRRGDEPVELVALRVRSVSPTPKPSELRVHPTSAGEPKAQREATTYDGTFDSLVYEREALPLDWHLPGPLIIEEPQTTTFVPPGVEASIGAAGEVRLER